MFGFLGFILILFLLIIFIGFSILGNILRVLFGSGKRNTNYQNRTSYTHQGQTNHTQTDDHTENYSETSSSSQKTHRASGNKKKIFDDEEGEYVDYEEIK